MKQIDVSSENANVGIDQTKMTRDKSRTVHVIRPMEKSQIPKPMPK